MARPARFELATYGFVVRHSIQLSYGRDNLRISSLERSDNHSFKEPILQEMQAQASYSIDLVKKCPSGIALHDLLYKISCGESGDKGDPSDFTARLFDHVGPNNRSL